MNAEALSSRASRWRASPASTHRPVELRPSARARYGRVPFVPARPLGEERGEHRQANGVGVGAVMELLMVVVPTGGIGVGEAVGDVEPSEVVEQVAFAVGVVPHHPLADRLDHDVEHAIDPGAGTHRIGDGGNDRLAVIAQQRCQQRAVVVPSIVDRKRLLGRRCRRRRERA